MFGYYPRMYFDPTMLLLIPGILLALWAQMKVSRAYNTFSALPSKGGWTGFTMARRIMDDAGLQDIPVEMTSGHLTDNYDPRRRVLRLSEGVYKSNSLAALGIAAHEVGHALQHAHAYAPMKLRSAIVPVSRIGTYAAWPLLILGMFTANSMLINIGIIAFSLAVVFQIITLPVEFNASSRAMVLLADGHYLSEAELPGARKVLSAAAMTYVAATLAAILQLLRLLLLFGGGRRRD